MFAQIGKFDQKLNGFKNLFVLCKKSYIYLSYLLSHIFQFL